MTLVLWLAFIRLTLALVGLLAAILRGVDGLVALVTFAVGAMILAFSVIMTRQGMWSGRDVRVAQPFRAALWALYPSSLGLAVLTAISVVLRPQLAALTAGMLAGLAFVAASIAAQIAWSRRLP
jgi:hypothetical protein